MSYSNQLNKKIEKICDYYENHDDLAFLQRIMAFIDDCMDLIDEKLFLLPETEVNAFRELARKVWMQDGSEQKLDAIGLDYQNRVFQIKPFQEIVQIENERAAFDAIGWYLSNYNDDPTNQFVYDFLELFVSSLNSAGVDEELVENSTNKHFHDIIETWVVKGSDYE